MRKVKIELVFTQSKNDYELTRIAFDHSINDTTIFSERGRNGGTRSKDGGFPWSSGVQSLALFFLTAKCSADLNLPILAGEAGSAAASLDYAISRQANWLLDSFGVDKNGISILRRVIKRSNPERKRPGPVCLFLNASCLLQDQIKIVIDNAEVEIARILEIKKSLEKHFKQDEIVHKDSISTESSTVAPTKINKIATTEHEDTKTEIHSFKSSLESGVDFLRVPSVRKWLKESIIKEISRSLACGADFSAERSTAYVSSLIHSETFKKYTPDNPDFFGLLSQKKNLSGYYAEMANLNPKTLREVLASNVCIHTPICNFGILGISKVCNKEFGGVFSLNANYLSAGFVLEKIFNRDYDPMNDLFLLGDGHLSELLASVHAKDFCAFMITPDLSFRMVAKAGQSRKDTKKELLIIEDPRSSSRFYLEDVKAKNIGFRKNITVKEVSTDHILSSSNGDSDTISMQWFPYYKFSELIENCELVDDVSQDSIRSTFLIVHKDFIRNSPKAKLVELVIRECWLRILESKSTLRLVVDEILDCPTTERLIYRSSGLHIKTDSIFASTINKLEAQFA